MASFEDVFGPAALKVERANHHINDLNAQINAFIARKPFGFVRKENHTQGKALVRTDQYEPIPTAVSLIAGDAIHNLRAALDMVMYGILHQVAKDPTRIAFPIAWRGPEALEGAINKGQANLCRKEVIDEIKALEPYPRGRYLLHELHELDVIDKHRLIITTTHETLIRASEADKVLPWMPAGSDKITLALHRETAFEYPIPRLPRRQRRAMRDDAIVETEIEVKPTFVVCFEEGQPLARKGVVAELQKMSGFVREACERVARAHVG